MGKGDLRRQYRFLMWGGGIFLIVIGLGMHLIVSFLVGEPMMLLYPYVTETTLLVIQIIGWIYIIPGIILFILGFWAVRLAKYGLPEEEKEGKSSTKPIKYLRIFVMITSILLIIAFPIGTFIGITLLRESWMLKNEN